MGGTKGTSSSYNVFMSFVDKTTGDASPILSPECYGNWVETRKNSLKQPEESFRRVLTAHVCGLIGRKPFPADVEASLLRALRRKQKWPCFKDSEVTIGIKGFRKTGFHESRRGIFGSNASSSMLSASPKVNPSPINRFLAGSSSFSGQKRKLAAASSEHSLPTLPHSSSLNSVSSNSANSLDPLDIFNSDQAAHQIQQNHQPVMKKQYTNSSFDNNLNQLLMYNMHGSYGHPAALWPGNGLNTSSSTSLQVDGNEESTEEQLHGLSNVASAAYY